MGKGRGAAKSIAMACVALVLPGAFAETVQLNQNCTVSVLNRNTQANPDGSWILPNVPANFGRVRARATCVNSGITTFGQSDYFTLSPNATVNLPHVQIGNLTPIPASISVTTPTPTITSLGGTAQLTVTATYNGAPSQNLTASSAGTSYSTTNPAIATGLERRPGDSGDHGDGGDPGDQRRYGGDALDPRTAGGRGGFGQRRNPGRFRVVARAERARPDRRIAGSGSRRFEQSARVSARHRHEQSGHRRRRNQRWRRGERDGPGLYHRRRARLLPHQSAAGRYGQRRSLGLHRSTHRQRPDECGEPEPGGGDGPRGCLAGQFHHDRERVVRRGERAVDGDRASDRQSLRST